MAGRVRGGRLLLDEPVDLPEGTEVELVPADEDRPVFTRRCGVRRTSSAPARGRVRRRCSPFGQSRRGGRPTGQQFLIFSTRSWGLPSRSWANRLPRVLHIGLRQASRACGGGS